MTIITIIVLAVAGFSILAIFVCGWLMWKNALMFPPKALGRYISVAYSVAATGVAGIIIWLIFRWTDQFLNPLSGSPGPFALILFPLAAGIACMPLVIGLAVMKNFHGRSG